MFRALFIYLSQVKWAQRMITRWGFARRAASRFTAGETPSDAIRAVQALNQKGLLATLDHLGENTENRAAACQATDDILFILDEIQRTGVRSNVSIKLSQIGLLLDQELCLENLERILARAAQHGNFVRIDMEDSKVTQVTIDIYLAMRHKGFENVGIVIQSYLYRSDTDIHLLGDQAARVRMVKGAYKEPVEVAYPNKKDVDASFDRLTAKLIECSQRNGCPAVSADGRTPPIPAIATHDEKRIEFAERTAEAAGLPKEAIEFQMLYGIRRDIQLQLAERGYPVRIYVPYGEHWYPYYMRRLAERPANVWFLVSNLLRDRGGA